MQKRRTLITLLVIFMAAFGLKTAPVEIDENDSDFIPNLTSEIETQGMSECEHSLHTNCVLKYGTRKLLSVDCDPTKILLCLTEHQSKTICTQLDADTLPTIYELQKDINRRFKKSKCASAEFLITIQSYFHVISHKVEHTQPSLPALKQTHPSSKALESSGSAEVPDDNEDGDDGNGDGDDGNDDGDEDNDDAAEITKNGVVRGETDKLSKIKKHKKDPNFWKLTSNQIVDAKRHVPGARIFFDDPGHASRIKKVNKNKIKIKPMTQEEFISNTWSLLTQQYSRWLRKTKYYTGT